MSECWNTSNQLDFFLLDRCQRRINLNEVVRLKLFPKKPFRTSYSIYTKDPNRPKRLIARKNSSMHMFNRITREFKYNSLVFSSKIFRLFFQSASSGISTEAPSFSSDDELIEKKEVPKSIPSRSSRHASARRLFEVNEWEEQQKRLKEKLRTVFFRFILPEIFRNSFSRDN